MHTSKLDHGISVGLRRRFSALGAAFCCGMMLSPVQAAENLSSTSAPPPPTQEIVAGPWIKIETFLRDPKNRNIPDSAAEPTTPDVAALPSLGGPVTIFSDSRDLTPAATHNVNFSTLPPMFERRRAVRLPDAPKPKAAALPTVPTPPIKAAPPTPAPTCAKTEPKSKQAAALADDRATLHALRQAVQDLRLEKELDFIMPQSHDTPQSTPAQTPAPATP